jgi:hypothetical protein
MIVVLVITLLTLAFGVPRSVPEFVRWLRTPTWLAGGR